ncbi:MAG: hypothetical protein ACR2KZ_03590 [Segetibacter sp.]
MKNKKTQMAKSTGHSLLSGIGILTMFLFISSCSSTKKTMSNDGMGMHRNNSTVAAFVAYVDANNKMLPDHSYINNALVKLADATNAMAGEINYTITPDLNKAKDFANKITQDANETTHSDNIRKSAEILSDALQNMQRSKYPGLSSSATELKGNADAITSNVLVHNQQAAIATFLKNSASLLQKMN